MPDVVRLNVAGGEACKRERGDPTVPRPPFARVRGPARAYARIPTNDIPSTEPTPFDLNCPPPGGIYIFESENGND